MLTSMNYIIIVSSNILFVILKSCYFYLEHECFLNCDVLANVLTLLLSPFHAKIIYLILFWNTGLTLIRINEKCKNS